MKTALLIIGMMALMAGCLLADSIHLKDGSVIQGKIISQTPGVSYQVQTLTGIQVIKQENIENIEFGPIKSAGSVNSIGERKSAAVAIVLSLVLPGTGNMYAGDMKRGAILLGADVLGFIVSVSGATGGNTSAVLVGNGIMLGSAITGCITSYNAVVKANQTAGVFAMNNPMSDVSFMSDIKRNIGYGDRAEFTLLRLKY